MIRRTSKFGFWTWSAGSLSKYLGRLQAQATKVRAADRVLNHTTKAIELEDLGAQVLEFERSAELAQRAREH